MQTITTIGLDIAKSVFQVHGIDAGGQVVARTEALGHTVRLMPQAYVKPYGAPRRRVLPVEEGSTQRVVD